ncbi:MAG: glycosyltransferase family 4 protein [Chloroflexi bacterium]|nr:glycosyltransferase family 4 protein [Chloroflexota bacterium]
MTAPTSRLRLAFFSPLPPQRTGIAEYSYELLPYLEQLADLTLFTDDPAQVQDILRARYTILPTNAYPQQRFAFDLPIYQIGNASFHASIYDTALRYPGIAVLHDYYLHHLIAAMTVAKGENARYQREMGYHGGAKGIMRAAANIRHDKALPLFELPLAARLINSSLGIIVHSRYVRSLIRQEGHRTPIQVAPQPIDIVDPSTECRDTLGWPPDVLIFASIGQLTATKHLDQALRAFAQVVEGFPKARYLIVGEGHPEQQKLQALVRKLKLNELVRFTGYVNDLAALQGWIAASDVVINLRYPTIGETSATALRALAAGKPLIVNDHGWYSELPDEGCWKLQTLDDGELVSAMTRLASEPTMRRNMGGDGRRYIAEHSTGTQAAQAYIRLAEHFMR